MPNGVSCAFFAGRNLVHGKTENNIFKEGIGCAQTVRTADSVVHSASVGAKVASPVKSALSKGAAIARKIVYPLIIGSGVYNTLVSDDKVRTGAAQAGGIGTMYAFEQISEKALNSIQKKLMSKSNISGNKWARAGWYIAKGAAFVAASLGGYTLGSSGGEAIVDKKRKEKEAKNADGDSFKKNELPVDSTLNPENVESAIFSDMEL